MAVFQGDSIYNAGRIGRCRVVLTQFKTNTLCCSSHKMTQSLNFQNSLPTFDLIFTQMDK